jgi:hypothetical protein
MEKHVKIGELEVPVDYFNFCEEDRNILCNEVMDAMLHILDKQLKSDLDRLEVLDSLLQSSIITNQEQEEYEVCAVLLNIRTLIHEPKN